MQRKKPKFKPSYNLEKPDMEGVVFSYKQPELLEKFISEQGAIIPRSYTGLSQKMQRSLAREVKRARHLALLPFTQTL